MTTPDEALGMLKEGAERFATGRAEHPNSGPDRIEATRAGQRPIAAVLACADSRGPVERVLDRGVGDLFVVRVAGAVVRTGQAASLELAVDALGVPLIVVMGHTNCAAVGAAASGKPLSPLLGVTLAPVHTAVDHARRAGHEGEALLLAATRENVFVSIADLLRVSAPIREAADERRLRLEGAVYDVGTGRVEWLGEHPEMARLIGG